MLAELQSYAKNQGMLVQEMHIRGKVHNPENIDLARELCNLCDRTESLQLPSARSLQVPVRSNRTGKLLTEGSLTHEVVNTVLASRCEWYILLTELAKDLDLTGSRSHLFATFGIGDCVPLSPFHKLQLQITKLDVLSLINDSLPSVRIPSLEDHYSFPSDAVAVIGASCRLPGANTLDELWDLMSTGTSRHVEVPTDRFDLHSSFRASQDWKFAGKRKFYGNFIDGVENYDHAFFRTNPKEAMNMDPQQRILLEVAYQAMESSGYLHSHQREAGDPVGCFIGASFVEYLDNTDAYPPSAYTSTGTIRAFLCGRISYYFGWSGPSEVIDTACSSSLVAINRACKAIQTGECTLALTGGVNIISGINNYLDLAKAGFLSPTGQCKPFDQSADGYCRSEGAGMVVLKLLRQAVADGDQILGVIPGIATNQGGLSSSITIPHSPAQKKLYQTVLRQAGMKPDQISYIEAHGTGTQAGDPLEVASIREVFGGPNRTNLLHLGSIKGNIGHCETAAGIAGLLKVLAMINRSSIPPLANHKSLNPKIPTLGPDKMCVATKVDRWDATLLAACVNSYGAAGSNCALLCCEGPPQYIEAPRRPIDVDLGSAYPIIVSAASKESLCAYTEVLERYLRRAGVPRPSIGDLAYTLSERRKHHRHRYVTTASDIADLAQSLKANALSYFEIPQAPKRIVLAFGGQSKQNVGLDEILYQSHPRLRSYVDNCNDVVKRLGYPAIIPSMFQSEPIDDVVKLQCGTFALQYSCARCWIDAGLAVDAIIGHSFGELTALVVSGVLSLPDGLKLIASRAALMNSKWGEERGSMLAIHSGREIVQDIIASIKSGSTDLEIEVACYNAPTSQVVVSSSSSITQVENLLRDDPRFRGIRCQRLDVSHGFHSKFTSPILSDLDHVSAALTFREPDIALETCTAEQIDQVLTHRPSQHARDPVYFSDAVQRIEKRLGPCVWLEAGMNSPIIPMIKKAVATQEDHFFQAVNIKDARPAISLISNVTMNLWREGISTCYLNFLSPKENGFKQISLPPYQFQPTPHWLANVDRVIEIQQKAPVEGVAKAEEQRPEEPLKLVTYKNLPNNGESTKEFQIHVATQRYRKIVSGHAVRQRPLCPASMYMECAAMAVQILRGDLEVGTLYFEDLNFQAALGVDLAREVSLTLEETADKRSWNLVIKSFSKADSKSKILTHAKGKLGLTAQPNLKTYQRLISDSMIELAKKPNTEKLMSNRAYGLFSQVVHYADFLQGISHIILDGTQAIADIDLPIAQVGIDESTVTHFCDTIAIDTFIQVVGLLINSSDLVTSEDVFVATGVDSISMSAACNLGSCKSWTVYTKFTPLGDAQAAGDIFVLTREGTLVMTIMGVRFTKLLISKLEKFLDSANAKPGQEPTSKPRFIPPTPPQASETTSEEGSEISQGLTRISSMTSVGDGLATPEAADEGAESLKDLIAAYTGLSASEISNDANISDLGVDSLAAVELAEELQSRFGKEILSEDLLMISYDSLARLVLPPPSANIVKSKATFSTANTTEKMVGTQHQPTPEISSTPQSRLGREDVLKLISDSSGAPVASIDDKATLQDLGVDSLSAVELKSEIEDAFSIEIEDDRFSLESTVAEILVFLGVDKPRNLKPSPRAAAPEISMGTTSANKSSESEKRPAESGQVNKSAQLADPIEALIKCEASFDNAATKCGFLNYWTDVAPKQGELLLAYILEAFRTLKVDLWRIPRGQIVPAIQHLPRHTKVMRRLLEILEKHHVITRQGSDFVAGNTLLPSKPSQELHETFLAQFPRYSDETKLMALTGPKLAECLSGKADAVSLMFRNPASQKVMEGYYTNSPMLATLTEQLVNFLRSVVTERENASVKILEVGAGFGGTTTRLADVLQSSGIAVQYTFTDISPTLVKGARTKFAKYNWMNFQTFNLETDVPTSLKDQYDIVIGTNCVHATASKAASIGRLKQLLRPDGFIILSEVTQIVDWYDIVFGLLDGWWLATDGSTYPLQPPESWMRSFTEMGFNNVSYSKGPTPESNTQRLLVASKKEVRIPSRAPPLVLPSGRGNHIIETVLYKEVDGTKILADIYLPDKVSAKAMPVGTDAV